MIKVKLMMALDFGKEKGAKEEHGKCSFLATDGKWHVCEFGPTYSNSYEVTEFDAAGEKWLLAHQRQGAVNAPKEKRP